MTLHTGTPRRAGRTTGRAGGAVAAAALTLLLASCSGSGGESGSGAPSSREPSAATSTGTPRSPAVGEPSPTASDGTGGTDTSTGESPGTEADPEAGTSNSGAAALWGTEYTGTAEVSVDVYEYCGVGAERRAAGTKSYSLPARLTLDEPREGGGQTEGNPFSLMLAVGQTSDAGALSFLSSGVATTSGEDLAGNPRDPELLLTYWDLAWTADRLTGELADPHTAEAAAPNLLNWADPLIPCRPGQGTLPGGQPHPVEEGATLEGELTADTTDLTARGATRTGLQEFELTFEGST